MKIRPVETFEQTHKKYMSNGGSFGSVEILKFAKNQVYEFYIVPKVKSIDLEADECQIDYPFEELYTHFGTYDFMQKYANMKPVRINCRGCAIDQWMKENRVPKSVFKIAVPTQFFVAYVIHDKKIKVGMFQDYLYGILYSKLGILMKDGEVNLIDAFRHRVKLFTNSEGKFDIEINPTVVIPTESQAYKDILVSVQKKPLEDFIDHQMTCDNETINSVLHALQDYSEQVIRSEQQAASAAKMEEKSKEFQGALDVLKNGSEYKPGGNPVFVESVGPDAEPPPQDDEQPF